MVNFQEIRTPSAVNRSGRYQRCEKNSMRTWELLTQSSKVK
uniref:Uncharacterized protein n=1 Tax=Schistosoma mansoni TaxID=6183 RepID=A0A3Q0KV98_SCHMA